MAKNRPEPKVLLHLQCLFHMLRYFTSGESHGEALVAFLSGLPAGLAVDQEFVDRELWRRQQAQPRPRKSCWSARTTANQASSRASSRP